MSVIQSDIHNRPKGDKPVKPTSGPMHQQEIEITFNPNLSKLLRGRNCKKIAFAQVLRFVVDGTVMTPEQYRGQYAGASLTNFVVDDGYFLDSADVQPTPDYQQADNPNVKNEDKADYGKIGNKSGKNFGPAILRDSPETDGPRENADGWKEVVFEFESVAYCEESGDFFEGITWEFRKPRADTYGTLKVISTDRPKPSQAFLCAFKKFTDVRNYKPASK